MPKSGLSLLFDYARDPAKQILENFFHVLLLGHEAGKLVFVAIRLARSGDRLFRLGPRALPMTIECKSANSENVSNG